MFFPFFVVIIKQQLFKIIYMVIRVKLLTHFRTILSSHLEVLIRYYDSDYSCRLHHYPQQKAEITTEDRQRLNNCFPPLFQYFPRYENTFAAPFLNTHTSQRGILIIINKLLRRLLPVLTSHKTGMH